MYRNRSNYNQPFNRLAVIKLLNGMIFKGAKSLFNWFIMLSKKAETPVK